MSKEIVNALASGTVVRGSNYSYKIVKALGQGSFGITYLASVNMSGGLGTIPTNVALKEFFMKDVNGRDDSTVTCSSKAGLYEYYKGKFRKEAENLGRLEHDNIIKVMELFEANNTIYYSMEYISGGSLDGYIDKRGGLTEQETLAFTAKILPALAFMHSRGVLHLDLKPSNIMMDADGRGPVLIDFGLSKQFDESGEPESSTTIGNGTPGYAPLEQGNSDDRSTVHGALPVTMDIYALGATMWKMLTGNRAPVASDVLNNGLPIEKLQSKGVSEATQDIILRAMAPLKKDRIQSAREFLSRLSSGDDESTEVDDGRGGEKEKVKPKPKRKRWEVVGCIALGIAFIVGMVLPSTFFSSTTVSSSTGSISGHDYVDLGLSVKWATCNVGASSPEGYGDYFAWGETSPKSSYDSANSKTYGKSSYNHDIGGDSSTDAARANWGGSWRLPTAEEFQELIDNCKWTWTTLNGKKGYKVVSKKNGNSIFLPAAGDRYGTSLYFAGEFGSYWSSTPYEDYSYGAYFLSFDSSGHRVNGDYRYDRRTVRPVSE